MRLDFNSTYPYSLVAACALLIMACDMEARSDTVATVNGAAIDSSVLDVYMENRIDKPLAQVTEEERQILLSELEDIYLLSSQDSAEALEKDPRIAAQIELQTRGVLAQAVAAEFFTSSAVTDAEVQAEYTEQVEEAPRIQFKARHILVSTQGEATDIIGRLDEGADFQELAKEKSTDSSGPNGGDLGWFSPNRMVKPFADAVALLEDGKYTASPVQTEFGWHVILREESRQPEPPTMESVRDALVQNVQQRKFQAHLEELRNNAAN